MGDPDLASDLNVQDDDGVGWLAVPSVSQRLCQLGARLSMKA